MAPSASAKSWVGQLVRSYTSGQQLPGLRFAADLAGADAYLCWWPPRGRLHWISLYDEFVGLPLERR